MAVLLREIGSCFPHVPEYTKFLQVLGEGFWNLLLIFALSPCRKFSNQNGGLGNIGSSGEYGLSL